MRFFELLNLKHFVTYLFPTLAFVALFIIALGFYQVRRKNAAERENQIIERYPGGIEGRDAPFPLFLFWTILGTVVWVLGYILFIGGLGVKI
jgi:membrane protein DedA with SNARE-associated domain